MSEDNVHFMILRTNSRVEEHKYPRETFFEALMELTDCRLHDLVDLGHGFIMLVDDEGLQKELPINTEATKIYNTRFNAGSTKLIPIVGDVAILERKDME